MNNQQPAYNQAPGTSNNQFNYNRIPGALGGTQGKYADMEKIPYHYNANNKEYDNSHYYHNYDPYGKANFRNSPELNRRIHRQWQNQQERFRIADKYRAGSTGLSEQGIKAYEQNQQQAQNVRNSYGQARNELEDVKDQYALGQITPQQYEQSASALQNKMQGYNNDLQAHGDKMNAFYAQRTGNQAPIAPIKPAEKDSWTKDENGRPIRSAEYKDYQNAYSKYQTAMADYESERDRYRATGGMGVSHERQMQGRAEAARQADAVRASHELPSTQQTQQDLDNFSNAARKVNPNYDQEVAQKQQQQQNEQQQLTQDAHARRQAEAQAQGRTYNPNSSHNQAIAASQATQARADKYIADLERRNREFEQSGGTAGSLAESVARVNDHDPNISGSSAHQRQVEHTAAKQKEVDDFKAESAKRMEEVNKSMQEIPGISGYMKGGPNYSVPPGPYTKTAAFLRDALRKQLGFPW